jgi:hypothetical protein
MNEKESLQNPEKYLSTRQAAAFLATSLGFIYKWRGSIPHVKIGGPKSGKLLFALPCDFTPLFSASEKQNNFHRSARYYIVQMLPG